MNGFLCKVNIRYLLLAGAVLFMPCTVYRFGGLKISEILICMMFLYDMCFYEIKIYKNYVLYFIGGLSILIVLSWCFSFIDPLSDMRSGSENGVYYSFELGAPMKIARLFILLYFFNCILQIKKIHKITSLLKIYVFSNFFLDIYVIISAYLQGGFLIGINRTAVLAQEPSEAGFINSMALIIVLGFAVFYNTKKKIFVSVFAVMYFAALNIGSAASVVFSTMAVSCMFLCYFKIEKGYKIYNYKLLAFLSAIIMIASWVVLETSLLDKILMWDYYIDKDGSSIIERLTAIEVAWRLFLECPILGVGWGNFGWYVDVFNNNPLYHVVGGGMFSANNQYAVVLSELGFLGMVVFVTFLVKNMFVIYHNMLFSRKLPKDWKMYSYVFGGMFIYLVLSGLTLNMIYSFQLWMTIAAAVLINEKLTAIA